jgi:mRNA degradation ribonuclease J1/J2
VLDLIAVVAAPDTDTVKSKAAEVVAGVDAALAPSEIIILGEVPLYRLYNDGNNATGNKEELFLDERLSLAVEGIVIASIEVIRPQALSRPGGGAEEMEMGLSGVVRITTRGMWIDEGRMLMEIQKASEEALFSLKRNATIVYIERAISNEIRKVRTKLPLPACPCAERRGAFIYVRLRGVANRNARVWHRATENGP